MGNFLETCKRRGCGHDKASHFKELTQSSKDVSDAQEWRYVYGQCLCAWCKCEKYTENENEH